MMSKKQWFVLLCLFIIYLLLGAIIFHEIEKDEEEKRIKDERKEKERIEGMLLIKLLFLFIFSVVNDETFYVGHLLD